MCYFKKKVGVCVCVCVCVCKFIYIQRGIPFYIYIYSASSKEPTCQCRGHKRNRFYPWVGKIPWRRAWQPILVFWPGESLGQGSLADTVHRVSKNWTWLKWLSTAYIYIYIYMYIYIYVYTHMCYIIILQL